MDIKNLNQSMLSSRSTDMLKAQDRESLNTGRNSTAANQNTDKVTLTDTLSQVRSLEQESKNVTVDNSARMAQIKAAIKDGSYQVNAEKIADRLMQTEALFARI